MAARKLPLISVGLLVVGLLLVAPTYADSAMVQTDAALDAAPQKKPKTLFVIVDGIPADVIERVNTPGIDAVVASGSYQRAYVGGEVGLLLSRLQAGPAAVYSLRSPVPPPGYVMS